MISSGPGTYQSRPTVVKQIAAAASIGTAAAILTPVNPRPPTAPSA
jgi:hypothetical protein